MSGSLRVWRAEFIRLATSRVAWLGAFLVFGVPFLRVFAAHLANRAKELERMASGGDVLGLSEGTGWALLVDGWRAGLMLGTALLLVHAARSIAGDRETGVLRLAVTKSASRTGAVVGRALVGPWIVLGIVLGSGLGAYVASRAFGGDFGPLVENNYEISTAMDVREELHRSLVVVTLGLVAVHAFGLMVSSVSRGPVLSLAASLAAILLWDVFKEDVGAERWFVFASHAPTFADGSAMREMAGFARGMSDAGMQTAVERMGLILSPAQTILFVAVAAFMLRKRPI